MPTDTLVNDLKINVLSEAQYEQIQSPSATELYLVPEVVDTTPTSGSTNPITSGGVYDALQNIPEQEQSDWNETDTTDPAYIKNKPTIPTNAADVSALPSSTKYAASLYLSVNSSTYVVTAQLKDQDGNNIGAAQTIDLPLESVVVDGSYNPQTKKVVLTLENGSTIEFSVADLVAGLQSEITPQNPLSADLVVDGNVNKVFTLTMRNKLAGIEEGAEKNVQADWDQNDSGADDFIKHKPTIPTVPTHRTINHEQITDSSLGDANLHDGFYFPNAVQDYDGNWYGAVVIGDQVWLGENLRTTHYADGTAITKASTASATSAVYLDNSSSPIPLEKRGYHYNYLAFSRDDETSEISSMTQGIAPNGWHIPTYNETQILKSYLNRQRRHKYNNTTDYIAKSIASTDYWGTSETVGAVGYDKGSNNSSGFNAFPCGITASNSFSSNTTTIWSGRNAEVGIKPMIISASSGTITTTVSYGAIWACSVRCVSDFTPLQFRDWYVKTYGTLQHNVLSSELSAGRDIAIFPKSNYLPTGYEELEYIEATGTQYINTNVYPAPNVQTNLKIGKTANTFTKFGSFAAAGSNYQVLLSTTIANNYYCSLWSSSVNYQYIVSTLNTFTIKFNKPGNKFSINNQSDIQLTPITPMDTSNPIGIFSFRGSSSSSTAIGRVYYIEIFNNETNEMFFKGIPARRTSDGSVGFYDTVTNTLFTNVGTGSFITGPVIAMNDKDTIVFTNESGYAILPSMSGNGGKVLAVNSGENGVEWVNQIPKVTSADNGKILVVENGVWVAKAVSEVLGS